MFACVDCKTDTLFEYYMVRASVWRAAGMSEHGGMLCLCCLENRLGGTLERTHFTDCMLNWYPESLTHVQRLAGDSLLGDIDS